MTHTNQNSNRTIDTRAPSAFPRRSLAIAGAAVLALVGGVTTLALSGGETHATPPMARPDGAPVVVELFTSQSCYSCPPAEAMLANLARRDGIIAIEHHVDYWDSLVHGSAGRWKDVFSSPESTARQRAYNDVVPGRGHSYTPQMVIDGSFEVVGNRDEVVQSTIRKARASERQRLDVAAGRGEGDTLRVSIKGTNTARIDAPQGIYLVRYLQAHTTEVKNGENQGKTLAGANVVRELRRIGEWTGEDIVIDVADGMPGKNHGCAILVQEVRLGPIVGAAYCSLDKSAGS